VSTGYYTHFHLLIAEATANWARPELRAILGRCFDHGPMRTASNTQINTAGKNRPTADAEITVAIHLCTIAEAFVQAQQRRNDADYNMAKEWTHVEVDTHIAEVNEAFQAWNIIRNEAAAKAYLVSLLGPKDQRANEPKTANAKAGKKQRRPNSDTPPAS
jgi:hypothetical protein